MASASKPHVGLYGLGTLHKRLDSTSSKSELQPNPYLARLPEPPLSHVRFRQHGRYVLAALVAERVCTCRDVCTGLHVHLPDVHARFMRRSYTRFRSHNLRASPL